VSVCETALCVRCAHAADDRWPVAVYVCIHKQNVGYGRAAASGPNSRKVRVTRSTFSRNAFAVSRARRTVDVLNVLRICQIGEIVRSGGGRPTR
jgi:hypothetical protein